MNRVELIEKGQFLGEEFLMWLWRQGQSPDAPAEGETGQMFFDDLIVLSNQQGEVKEISLRKGNPSESLEAFEALHRGMRPVRAKLRLLAGDMEWAFSLDARTFNLGAIQLPPTQSGDLPGRLADRLFLVEECTRALEERFGRFLAERLGDEEGLRQRQLAWIREGLDRDDGPAPWAE